MQQHYLPKVAYLGFFQIIQRPGFIYFYRRAEEAIVVSAHNVAKEKHLYSFIDPDGKYDVTVEKALTEIEEEARPVLEKLNGATGTLTITGDERARLVRFVSFQAVRIPAFRRVLKEFEAGYWQMVLQAYAQRKEALHGLIERAKVKNPGKNFDDVNIEDLQEFLLDEGRYVIQVPGQKLLARQLDLQKKIFPALWIRKIEVLRVSSMVFVTSDNPVVLLRDPRTPNYMGAGFLNSDIILPIGRQATLLFSGNEEDISGLEQLISVPVANIFPFVARQINKITISNAEQYIFSSERDEKIKRLFDKTTVPTRFAISHPFGRSAKN